MVALVPFVASKMLGRAWLLLLLTKLVDRKYVFRMVKYVADGLFDGLVVIGHQRHPARRMFCMSSCNICVPPPRVPAVWFIRGPSSLS